jgi:hypothetical protein
VVRTSVDSDGDSGEVRREIERKVERYDRERVHHDRGPQINQSSQTNPR